MQQIEWILLLLISFSSIFIWSIINPKLDWNYETDERILWYNDPFDNHTRKSIVIYKKKS